jgi:hypothetical protein
LMMNKRVLAAAVLTAGLIVHTPGFTQVAINTRASSATKALNTSNPEAAAQQNWRTAMTQNPASGQGCFHASYPNYVWEAVNCQTAQASGALAAAAPTNGTAPAGAGNDYVAHAHGLISTAVGEFRATSVTSVKTVGGGIQGPNEYSVQLNTNDDQRLCPGGDSLCRVWQQFVYQTDKVNPTGTFQGGLYIVYALLDWGSSDCPSGYRKPDTRPTSCFMNSAIAPVPNIPITELDGLSMTASATPGGNDVVQLVNQTDIYQMVAEDSVLKIGSVWQEAEFNIFGNAGDSQAVFNAGATINVYLSVIDGSSQAPACMGGSGTTSESNNLNLGPCYPSFFLAPLIQFSESRPNLRAPIDALLTGSGILTLSF